MFMCFAYMLYIYIYIHTHPARLQYVLPPFDHEEYVSMKGNVVLYTAAISACARAVQWQHAVHQFSQMKNSNICGNMITYSALTDAELIEIGC